MSGWKKSPEQARLMEEEAIDHIDKEFHRKDNPPNLDQNIGASNMLREALVQALEANGIENTVINALRVAAFNLATLEHCHYSSVNPIHREIHKDVVCSATDNALKNVREFLNRVGKGG